MYGAAFSELQWSNTDMLFEETNKIIIILKSTGLGYRGYIHFRMRNQKLLCKLQTLLSYEGIDRGVKLLAKKLIDGVLGKKELSREITDIDLFGQMFCNIVLYFY